MGQRFSKLGVGWGPCTSSIGELVNMHTPVPSSDLLNQGLWGEPRNLHFQTILKQAQVCTTMLGAGSHPWTDVKWMTFASV